MDHIVGRNAGEIGAKSGKVRNGPDPPRTDGPLQIGQFQTQHCTPEE
jgi:hypothetical protein